jgi:hypothetical protein
VLVITEMQGDVRTCKEVKGGGRRYEDIDGDTRRCKMGDVGRFEAAGFRRELVLRTSEGFELRRFVVPFPYQAI